MALGLPQMRFDIFARDNTGPAWRGVESRMQRAQRSVAGFLRVAAPLLGIGGATALSFMARDALEFADALVQAADRTSFAVEELEALRYAGRLNRVQFNQTDMAMQRFSRRLAEAATGSGELANDLEALNIPLRDANGQMRSSYDILLDYADAIQNAESEQEQLRLAFRAFDSEGAAFVTAMRRGSEGLREYRSEAEEAGVIMGDQLAREASEAATALEAMNMQLTAERNRVIAEHADDLLALAEAFSAIVTAAVEAGAAIGRFYQGLDRAVATEQFTPMTADQIRREREVVGEAAEYWGSAYREGRAATALPGRLTSFLGARKVEQIEQEFGSLASEEAAPAIYEALLRRYRELGLRLSELENDGATRPGSGTARTISETEVTPRINPRRPEDEDVKQAIRDALVRASVAAAEEFEEKAAEIFRKEQKDLLDFEELAELQEEFSQTFADAFAGGIMAAVDGDLQEYIARRLRQAAYNGLYEAFEALGSQVWERITNGGKTDGGLIGRGIDLLGSRYGGKKAAGGMVTPGKFYQWQENGRELFAPRVPGEIIPAGGVGGGGQTIIQQHFHLHAEGAVMTDQLLKEMDDKANRAATSASTKAQQQMNDRASKRNMSFN